MSNVNFSGVGVAEELKGSQFVEPGYQKLTITKVEDAVAGTGSIGYAVTFESDKGGTFTQKWFTQRADGNLNQKPAESFQYLVNTFTGQLLGANENTMTISAKLVGKTAAVTVGGEKYTSEKDGKVYNNIRPQLPFGGYSGERTPYIRGEWADQVVVNSTADEDPSDLPQMAAATQDDSTSDLTW